MQEVVSDYQGLGCPFSCKMWLIHYAVQLLCVYLEKEEKAILVLAAKETKLLSEIMKYWYLMSSTLN